MLFIPFSICFENAENSWPRVIGVASIKCVLPIFTISLNSFVFLFKEFNKLFSAGIVFLEITS